MLRIKLHPTLAAAALVALSACTDMGALPTAPAPLGPNITVSTYASQIVINEVMADPDAVTDANGEWLEIHNRGAAAVDLQGWTLASNNDASQTIASSVSVPAGGYVVLAKNGNSGTNGGVTEDYVYSIINLANSSDWVALRDGGGA
ncbi:MAG TPA: lamin tail domain-containing protein, partial [Longimicrobium sp.]|nr:lamin tail domain-containing protein [Longimicrobium sp.]